MSDGATGTVTFLFTDIEGSTERWQLDSRAMAEALAAHDEVIRAAVERRGGVVFKHTGDGMCAVFPSAGEAVAAAMEAQAGLALPVRMGLHTGEAESRDGDYFGPTLNRAARVMDAGHGGQVLVSAATAGLLRDHDLVDLGEHQLKGLEVPERIHQVGRGDFPALRTLRPIVGNLPVELSTFVGRADEVGSIVDELGGHRLVTLIGVGGTGKTRLAIETGTTLAERFGDGCWLVELAMVTVDEAVPFAFAAGLGITAPPEGDVLDHVIARLRHKRCLVVVDNCEHVLGAAADAVERIVAGCRDVAVLATSREPLMVRGERLVPVPSLQLDDAVELFLQRAHDEAPDLVIDDDQQRAVAELCRRLDGLPLALELAASRVRALTPVELVVNLEERFRMLVGGRRSRMERHQTMRGTLDWSYDLCREVEQAVFDRLSVFPASFDLAAARAVAGGDGVEEFDVADVVPQLVDRSLLQRSTAADGTTRYRMLETMRAYGREHLHHQGQSDATRERHARFVAATLAGLVLRSVGPDEVAVGRRIAEYLPDALVALDWFIDHQDWEGGLMIAVGGPYVSQRESGEMAARLHDAARAGGASGDVLDELDRMDGRGRLTESMQQSTDRGWRTIRARLPIPVDRVSVPPHLDFNDGGLLADDVDEFVASLEHWSAAPAVTRFLTDWFAVRALANSGHVDRAEQLLGPFGALVAGLRSRQASRLLADLRGTLALQREDWPAAARWYGEVTSTTDGGLTTWFDLVAAWHHLGARCLTDEPGDVSGADLRDPWICFRNERIDVLRWHGAVATAIALRRLGEDDLAVRLAGWVNADDAVGIVEGFRPRLEAAGFDTTATSSGDDLETLIDEVLALADRLDGR
jgi:predicted ATPase